MKTLIFPDGLKLSGFRWSLMGFWYRWFPDSGSRDEQRNILRFTNAGIEAAGIVMVPDSEGA